MVLDMIEVEKKFRLTSDQEENLLRGAELIKEGTNVDVFFDTQEFTYSLQDIWLRTRNGKYELKVGQKDHQKQTGAIYEEIENEMRIRAFLKLSDTLPLAEALQAVGIFPYCRIAKARKSYRRDGFRIDLDICDFGYELAEIELLVEHPSQTTKALERIQTFADSVGLDSTPQRGKVIEYLFRFQPEHYQALVNSGVIDL
ncbi:CYTH domain-containing protein [Candidatus Uhrbacteria bacterium]|nr:CYTH domain-containing protein [Candidatus Uhrbacteria bacterium]